MKILILLSLFSTVLGREISSFIIGGVNSNIANHKHQLSLRISGSHSCGASLISTQRAVTAAHCGGGAVSLYSILGGTSDRTITTCSTCVLRDLITFVRNPEYVDNGINGYPNDIAVITFTPLTFNSNLSPIVLAVPLDGDYANVRCTITGWGRTTSGGALPTLLQQVSVTALSPADCVAQWGASRINSGHICISAPSASACSGDDGGPLVCSGKLAGAYSWGDASCSPNLPSVYSRISYFYSWIMAQ